MFTDAAKNNCLDAEGTTHLSLHTAYSAAGANELSGGSPAYARGAATFAAAAGGSKALSATVSLDVPAGSRVAWIGRWTALSGGTFLGMGPLQGDEVEFTVDLGADTIRRTAHGLVDDELVVFVGGTPPGGLTEGTEYHVVSAAADSFQVAATQGGAAIDLTSAPGDSCTLSRIVPETFASQGVLEVTTAFTLHLNH
jgi:hypothetical protein